MGCSSCSSDGGTPKGCKSNGSCGTGGCNKLVVFDWLSNMTLPNGQEPFDWVELRFKNGRKEFFKNVNNLTLQTGEVVAYTNSDWQGLVIHRAPLDKSCEKSAAPETECQSSIASEPEGWSVPSFSDTSWTQALEYSAEAIGVKDGYNDISWAKDARLIWSSDLEIDNTILWRYSTLSSPQG